MKRGVARAFLAFIALLALVGAPLGLAPWFGWGSKPRAEQAFDVKKGASLTAVADRLRDQGLIGSAGQFRILARLLGDDAPVQAGRYRLRPGMPWGEMLRALQQGKVARSVVTIPEGWPSVQVADRLRGIPDLKGDIAVPAEGSILPDTYEYQPGEPRAAVVLRMQAAMDRAIKDLWPQRTARTAVKTPAEAVILAGIVEKETGKAAERRTIAGVYSNRLRIGMKLDADPTLIYPITQGRPLGRRIRLSEKNRDTGYNTYLKPGLPKGPITNPGRDSLMAVLDPAETDALFFVADGSGGHLFSRTLAQQNANRERWFALRRQRGEM
jgi:UPF0755 protein